MIGLLLCLIFGSKSQDDSYPFNCSDFICPSYSNDDGICTVLCMSPPCNFDSNDYMSDTWFERFLSSDCFSSCNSLGCNLTSLKLGICDNSCNHAECGFGLSACGFCASGCTEDMLNNGIPDTQCNTSACMYDNNEFGWCARGCFQESLTEDSCIPACNNADCDYQNLVCDANFCAPGCSPEMQFDTFCDDACNNTACNYANWSCTCAVNCSPDKYNSPHCQPECDNEDCAFQNGICGSCNSKCFDYMIGDGNCTADCNVENCNFDSGDCSCAPGCSSQYSPSEDKWTWDSSNKGCNPSCLVENCLYNNGACTDEYLIRAAWLNQALNKNTSQVLDLSLCNTQCSDETLRGIDNGTYLCSNYQKCNTAACIYCMGTAEKSLTCTRFSSGICLLCANSMQIYDKCFSAGDCPSGYEDIPALDAHFLTASVCLREPRQYSINNFFNLYLSSQGNDANNGTSTSSPLQSLSLAFQRATRQYTVINIASGNYYYKIVNPDNSLVTDNTDPLNPAVNYQIQILNITGNYTNRPVIYLYGNNMKIHSYALKIYISYVIFDGSYALNSTCTLDSCKYCPYLLNVDNTSTDDHSNIVTNNNIQNIAQNCPSFTGTNFIQVFPGSELSMNNCDINNFQQQLNAFIYAQGSVTLTSVNFTRIQASASGSFIYMTCSSNCSKIDFTYRNGNVTNVNYGYAYVNDILQSGFLSVQGINNIQLNNVHFQYAMSVTGPMQSQIDYLLYFRNVIGSILIDHSSFQNCFVNGLIYIDSTSLSYSNYYSIDKSLNIEQLNQTHLVIQNTCFNNVTSLWCFLCHSMNNVVQNILFSNISLSNIVSNNNALIQITNTGGYLDADIKGAWTYVTIANVWTKGYNPPKFFIISQMSFDTILHSGSIISLTQYPNVIFTNINATNSRDLTYQDMNTYTINNFITPNCYLQNKIASSQINQKPCSGGFSFDTLYNLSLTSFSLSNLSCSSGISGLSFNKVSGLIIKNLSLSGISGAGNFQVASITSSTNISLTNFYIANIHQNISELFKITGASYLEMINTTGKNLASGFSSCFLLQSVLQVNISTFSCSNCGSDNGDGGTLYLHTGPQSTKITIQGVSCSLCYSTTGSGGAIFIDGQSASVLHYLSLSGITISSCIASDGTGIYISSHFSISTGSISQLSIAGSTATKGCVFTDLHRNGKLYVISYTSQSNSGFYTGIKGGYSESGLIFAATSVTVQDSRASIAAFSFSSLNSSTIVQLAYIQISRASQVLAGSASSVILSVNSFSVDSGSGLYLSNSTLIGTSLSFSSLIGNAISGTINSTVTCNNCSFANITNGPALVIENSSVLNMTNSSFSKISSSSPGIVLYMSLCKGNNTLNNCTFTGCSSNQSSLIEIQGSNLSISNSIVKENYSLGMTSGVSVISSSLSIYNSVFANQTSVSGGFLYISTYSTVAALGSSFISGATLSDGGAVYFIMSSFNASNCIFQNNSAVNGTGGAIYADSSSSSILTNCSFIDNYAALSGLAVYSLGDSLYVSSSNFYMTISNVQDFQIDLLRLKSFTFISSQISGISTSGIRSFYTGAVTLASSSFANLSQSLYVASQNTSNSKTYSIRSCNFSNASNDGLGGAIYSEDVSLMINNSNFVKNSANSGGGIYFTCSYYTCSFDITNSAFISNNATVEGGAIKWEGKKPSLVSTTFINNTAAYGANEASYPAFLLVNSKSRFLKSLECTPGTVCNETLIIYISDSSNNVMILDNSSTAIMTTDKKYYSVSGKTNVTATNGAFTFDAFIIFGEPSSQVNITIATSAIDPSLSSKVGDSVNYTNSLVFQVSLRNCTLGEEMTASSCTFCSENTYTIQPNPTCRPCPTGGNCTEGWKIYVIPGYWKAMQYSTVVYSCPLSIACLGSTTDEDFTGSCADGYIGSKCLACDVGYSRSGSNKCGKCPSPGINALILGFLLIFIIFIGVILVRSTLTSAYTPTALYSIYIKIFTNYIQLVFLTTQLDLQWPWYVQQFFVSQKTVATASDQIVSLDCYFTSHDYTFEETYYYKLITIAFLPLIAWLIAALIWFFICLHKKTWIYMKKELLASMIVLFFLFYPNIVKAMFAVFSCTEIVDLGWFITDNLVIECWTEKYVMLTLTVAFTSIIVWALGVPTLVLITLVKRRNFLSSDSNRVIFGFLFNGYKQSRFFWEFIIMYRKIMIISITVFMTQVALSVQALTLVLLLIVCLYLQYEFKPYNKHRLNHMEMEAILTASITIYCGVYYLTDSLDEGFSTLLFFFILTGNLYFVLYWLYYMLQAVIDFLSFLSPALQRLTGNMDPFPQISQDCRYVKQGVERNEEEGILKFTLISKSHEENCQADLKGFNELSDVYMKTYERYKEKQVKELDDMHLINTSKNLDNTYYEELQDTYVQTFNQDDDIIKYEKYKEKPFDEIYDRQIKNTSKILDATYFEEPQVTYVQSISEYDDMKSYEEYKEKQFEESIDSQSIKISRIMDEELSEDPQITFVRIFNDGESSGMSCDRLAN